MSVMGSSTVSVRVPFRLRKHGGRKLVVTPDGEPLPLQPQIDNALVKAIARAYRWKRLMEAGEYGSLTELAEAEKINRSYVSRVLRLTLLAPEIVEAILGGRQGPEVTMAKLMEPFPVEWQAQGKPAIALVERGIAVVDGDMPKSW